MTPNKNKSRGLPKILVSFLITGFVLAGFFTAPSLFVSAEEDIGEINQEIENKRREIDVLQKEIDAYKQQIKEKQKEATGLNTQISILDNQIAKVNLDIEATEKRIEQTKLEIESINLQIKKLEEQIKATREKIGEYLRLIYKNDKVSYLEVLLVNDSFSEFFDQIKYTEEIHSDLKSNVDKLKNTRQDLEIQEKNLKEKVNLEEELKNELNKQKDELEEKNLAQGILLAQARLTERQYQNYTYQLQLEQQQANSEIISLEKTVRQRLEERELAERFAGFGPARLAWPVDPSRGITAFFHDPDYPFRYIFEHPAIDIRASQGTPIKAPEGGYVARVKFANNSSYAYIMLIHNDGISTVFGHISKPLVAENEYVSKGQSVALSGGLPGGIGSGNLSTGPHVHFEVRLDGIPVNPLEYLPGY